MTDPVARHEHAGHKTWNCRTENTLQFHVLHFPVLGPSFSCPAFSCPAFHAMLFMSCIFTRCDFVVPSLSRPAHFQSPLFVKVVYRSTAVKFSNPVRKKFNMEWRSQKFDIFGKPLKFILILANFLEFVHVALITKHVDNVWHASLSRFIKSITLYLFWSYTCRYLVLWTLCS